MKKDDMSEIPEKTSIRVLHVDDDPKFGELVTRYLEKLNEKITVRTETAPQKGLEHIDTEPIDCIVSDYQMPEMDGLDFLNAVREEYPNLPFILFTGKGSEEIASEAIQTGVTDYLQKDGSEQYELLANRIQQAVSQRRSERRAKIAQHRLIRLYEQVDGFYTLDEDWTITYWNREMVKRTGLPPEEVIGEEFWDVFPEARETRVYDHFQTAMEMQEELETEIDYEPHGYWAELRIYPVDSGLFIYSRDITDDKEREQQLQYRNELLESFASTVSHDLRNPLSVAEGNVQLAQETGDFEHLEAVTQAHNRMRNLIDELLHVARGDQLDLSEVSSTDVAELAWETVSSDTADLVLEGDLVFEAYKSQLRRLFENLFWNALDHGEAVEIRVGSLDDGFYVEDDGIGIPPPHREEVFESGFSTDDESPGYGLSIVNGIIEIHDWDIDIVEGTDGGARFEITSIEIEE
jgi:PAS domain S-box-containing protein